MAALLPGYEVCPHCEKVVSDKTFREHKRLYFYEGEWYTIHDDDKSSRSSTPMSIPSVEHEIQDSYEDSYDDEDSMNEECNNSGSSCSDFENGADFTCEKSSGDVMDFSDSDVATEYWDESDDELNEDIPMASMESQNLTEKDEEVAHAEEVTGIIWWIVAFTCFFQSVYHIPVSAIQYLLKFIHGLLKLLGKHSPFLSRIAEAFPQTLYLRDKFLQQKVTYPTITNYVVCRNCHSLYLYDNAYSVDHANRISSKICVKCNSTKLLLEVVTKEKSRRLYPYLSYPYCSVIESLKCLVKKPGFMTSCEHQRNSNPNSDGILNDISDGSIWNLIKLEDGTPFFAQPNNYGLIFNVDWFQPFKHRSYSVGVLYFAVLNLPRDIRYKMENIIVIGIIQGPLEPSGNINSYLTPIVTELDLLWKGVDMCTPEGKVATFRCVLICLACDLPAGRKVAGLLGHSANLACSRCYKEFSTGKFGEQDCSGFDRNLWVPRSNDQHRYDVQKIKAARNETKRKFLESKKGCRYSTLLELSYFDPISMLAIDPMHNLYLGTAKHTYNVWIKRGIIDKNAIKYINHCLSLFHSPRIPTLPPIDSCKYTAEQWMNWVNFYSLVCLWGVLNDEYFECWKKFVHASRLLCKQAINKQEILLADGLILEFCRRFEALNGPRFITPNMHLNAHICECVKQFGPMHSFWLYSFERYNGFLGDIPTNNRSIELQIMQRFVKDSLNAQLIHSLPSFTDVNILAQILGYQKATIPISACSTTNGFKYTRGSKYKLKVLDTSLVEELQSSYTTIYGSSVLDQTSIPLSYRSMEYIVSNNKRYKLGQYVAFKSSHPENVSLPQQSMFYNPNNRVGKIRAFVEHSYPHTTLGNLDHLFILVTLLRYHPQHTAIGSPVLIWEKSSTDGFYFVPIEDVLNSVLWLIYDINEEAVLVTIPDIY